MRLAVLILIAAPLLAQTGQQGPRPQWPCVPGRAFDPAYLDLAESTGGQLVLFQKGEAAHAAPVMSAPYTHPTTILRLVGHLNGTRDLEFPLDATVETLLVLASVQCRERVTFHRPSGIEVTARDAPLALELTSASIIRIDQPEPGKWKLRLKGNGLFVASVLAKSQIAVTEVAPSGDDINIRVAGPASNLSVQLFDAAGIRIRERGPLEQIADGYYRAAAPPKGIRYRVVVTGEDSAAWPFQRTHPVLFQPN